MSSNPAEKLLEEFPPVSREQWEEAIRHDLGGSGDATRLIWETEEGIAVRPYYRSDDLTEIEGGYDARPGQSPYLRGTKADSDWKIRETVDEPDPSRAGALAGEHLRNGADEISFLIAADGDGAAGVRLAVADDLRRLLETLPYRSGSGKGVPIHFEAGSRAGQLLRWLVRVLGNGEAAAAFSGSIDGDPLGDLTVSGGSPYTPDELFDDTAQLARLAAERAPGVRPLTVRAWAYHEAGATAVQQLGYTLAHAAEYLARLTDRGLSTGLAASAFTVSFSVGAQYFLEIAKLRAARVLWAHLVSQFGSSREDAARLRLHVRTVRWNQTRFDPYVNVLRATTEAMSAVVAGCDSLSIEPFNAVAQRPDERARRLARSTQLILKHEAHLDRVADPAGGAYFIEALTDSMAREAWKLFQQVEAEGGFLECLQRGSIQGEIKKSAEAKNQAIATGERVFVGTTKYLNPEERSLAENLVPQDYTSVSRFTVEPRGSSPLKIQPLELYRGPAAFEETPAHGRVNG